MSFCEIISNLLPFMLIGSIGISGSGGSAGPAQSGGMQTTSSGRAPDTVNPTQVIPTITSGHTTNGPVTILGTGTPPSPTANPNQVQYRVELTGIQLDFSASDEIDFLIYATATEEVQPGIWSDPTDQPTSNSSPPPPPLLIGKISSELSIPTRRPSPSHLLPSAGRLYPMPRARLEASSNGRPTRQPPATWYGKPLRARCFTSFPRGSPAGTPDPPADTPYADSRQYAEEPGDHLSGPIAAGLCSLDQGPNRGQSH